MDSSIYTLDTHNIKGVWISSPILSPTTCMSFNSYCTFPTRWSLFTLNTMSKTNLISLSISPFTIFAPFTISYCPSEPETFEGTQTTHVSFGIPLTITALFHIFYSLELLSSTLQFPKQALLFSRPSSLTASSPWSATVPSLPLSASLYRLLLASVSHSQCRFCVLTFVLSSGKMQYH